jgi:hypothetical protein
MNKRNIILFISIVLSLAVLMIGCSLASTVTVTVTATPSTAKPEPPSTANKPTPSIKIATLSTNSIEDYIIFKGILGGTQHISLNTIYKWTGNNNKNLDFNANVSPSVINYGYTSKSNITSSFRVNIQGSKGSNYPPIGSDISETITNNGTPIEGLGQFRLIIISSGCEWWIKIGVEKIN